MLMQNNFSKCREWVPRGTSQHKWRWLTTLLLILTLGIGQMWGVDQEITFGTAIATKSYVYSSSTVADNTILSDKAAYYSSAKSTPGLNNSKIIAYRLAVVFSLSSSANVEALMGKNNSKTIKYWLYSITKDHYDFIKSCSGQATDIIMLYNATATNSPIKTLFKDAGITNNDASRCKLLGQTATENVTTLLYSNEESGCATSTTAATPMTIYKAATGTDKDVLSAGYYILYIDNGSSSGNTLDKLSFTSASTTPDTTKPTLSSSTPTNSATSVATSGNIVLTFSENVIVNDASKFSLSGGEGSLTTASISVSGAAVTIPYTGLENNTTYTFSADAGAVKDAANNTSDALADISFTTVEADVTPPTLSSSTPANNAANIATSGNIVLTFSENVSINDASKFSIEPSTGVTLNTAGATVSGATVTIPYSGLSEGTEYTFSTAAEAVKDAANNKSAALSDITFTTLSCAVSSCGNASLTYSINGGSTGNHATGGTDLISSATPSNATALGASTTPTYEVITMSTLGKKAAAKASSCYPTAPNMSGKIDMHNGESYSSTKYLQFTFTVNPGYTFTPCDIQFVVQPVSATGYFRWEITDGTTSYGYGTGEAGVGSSAGATVLTGLTSTSEMSAGTYYIRLYPYYNGSNTFRISNDVILRGTTAAAVVTSYDIAYTTPSNGSYTIQVGEAAAVSANTTANNGETITLVATPASGYRLKAWDVYKTGESTTKVSVSNNTFTMPAYAVTVSATFEAIPTVADLVTIADDYTFTPSAAIAASTLAEDNKFIALEDGCTYGSNGLLVKENRPLAFKVNNGAKVKVTFTTNGDREMQLGTAASDDDNKAYGHSKTSPVVFDVTADGVVYLTASSDLRFSKLEITYPHIVTYALNGGEGTLPTESAHYVGDKFNLHNGEDGITAPTDKEFAGWNDGTTTYVGGAEYTMGASAVILTAQWATPLPEPTITFDNGNYTVAGAALDLSTLFSSNSDGAVTYTVKTAGETGAAIDGTNFSATAAGSAVVTATQAATASYKTKSEDATITISAPSEVDGIKMVVDGDLTGNFRTSQSLSTLSGSNKYTIAGLNYTKYIKFGSSVSSWSAVAGPSNKYLVYTPTKKTTNFYFYVHNNSSASYINLYLIEEGNVTPTKVQVSVDANENARKMYELNITKNTEVYITAESNNVYFCQVVAVESGDALLQAPAVDYAMNLNKGRLSTASNTETTLEGLTFKLSSGYSIASGSSISIGTKGTHYVSFTIPDGQTRQLQLTTSNKVSYMVSKTLGDDTDPYTPVANNETKNWNLTEGTWYINPQGSNVNITNIAFAAAPAQKTVTFKDGASTLDTKSVWSGDKVSALDPAPTKSGYRFVKWQLSGADYDFNTAVTADIELDAVWQQVWTVTFDADNETTPTEVTVDAGQAVAQPANPTRAGFDFVEWQLNSVVYDFATPVTANITLVATWEVAQDDATLSALSYNGNAINVASAEDVSGVQTYTVHLPWGSTIDPALVSITKNAESATVGSPVYDSENKRISFAVESGNHAVLINYAIQFVIDAKRGTSIVKATTNNVVTGLIGGTIDQSYSGNANSRKLNKGNYFGVTLANDETFQEGDVFIVNITTPADLGKFMIYADKNRTELIADQGIVYTKPDVASPVVCPTGEMMLVLPAAANGKKSLYLSRENVDNSEQWNVTFSYIEVTREMNPAIKSFKFGDDAATINESAKTITYEVAYGTAVTALTPTVEAYGNNGATYTPAGATDFTSPVVYTVTDGYNEFHTDYTVTVNIAAPSENANLASLAVEGYSLDFDPATTSYNVVLDYGTTVLPTITYEVAEVGIATANKVEGGVNGATTITVTPQAGAGYEKVYTINFSVNTTPTFKVFDGRTMNAAIVSFTDPTSGMTWTSEDASTSSSSNTKTINGKTYTKSVKIFGSATSASRYLKFTVPADYVAKFYLAGSTNSSTGEATLFFSKELTADPVKAIAGLTASVDDPKWAQTDYQLPGDYYFCVTGSARIYELSVTLYPIDEERAMTQGRFGTICYPNGGRLLGAMLLEIAYFDPDQKKIFFDEVVDGQMVAGAPYLFLPNEGVDKFAIVYTDNVNAPAGHHNGLYGSYTQEALPTDGNHYIMLNNQYCKVVEANTYVGANRAYILLNKIGNDYVAPSYGRRRVSMDVQGEQVATGMEGLNVGDQPIKLMINGQMYILRGDKMYDATGRLVK